MRRLCVVAALLLAGCASSASAHAGCYVYQVGGYNGYITVKDELVIANDDWKVQAMTVDQCEGVRKYIAKHGQLSMADLRAAKTSG